MTLPKAQRGRRFLSTSQRLGNAPREDYFPDLSTSPRPLPVEPSSDTPKGIHTTYLSSASSRSTEASAIGRCEENFQDVTPEQWKLLQLEHLGMMERPSPNGKTTIKGRQGMPLYLWICKVLKKDDPQLYRDWTAGTVFANLSDNRLEAARKYLADIEMFGGSMKKRLSA